MASNFQDIAASRYFSISFSGLLGLEFLRLGCLWCFERIFVWCGAVLTFFFLSPASTPPGLCRTMVRVFMPLAEARDCWFFVFVRFRPAGALLSPEGTLFAHNAVQSYI